MTDPFETVREALAWGKDLCSGMRNMHPDTRFQEALAALEKIKERYVPELPDEWWISELSYDDGKWRCELNHMEADDDKLPTTRKQKSINSAVSNAIKAIGER